MVSKLNYKGEIVCFKNITAFKKQNDQDAKARLQVFLFRELDITNRVRHPCTVELLYFDLTPNFQRPAIVTKFYENGALSECFLKDYKDWGKITGSNRFTGTVYTILMYGIARGLRYLHNLKIIHRDIKPENIVIDEFYRPHITDFGLSKVCQNEEQSDKVGSILYMAPEIRSVKGKVKFSYPVDVFALSFVFYAIVKGKVFYPDLNERKIMELGNEEDRYAELRRQVLQLFKKGKMPQFEDNFNDQLQQLIEEMWSYKPEDRPTMDQVCERLEKEETWLSGTDPNIFQKYKKEIDDYEAKQLPLLNTVFPINEKQIDEHNKQFQIAKEAEKKYRLKLKKIPKENKYTLYSYKLQRAYLLLSERQNNEAEFNLGVSFYTGYKGIPKDYVQALIYFRKASSDRNLIADTLIINILSEIKQAELKTTDSCSDSSLTINDNFFANLKDMKAQLLMGMVKEAYDMPNEALELYTKSAKQGSIRAKGRIGILLLRNKILLDQAEILLKQASKWKLEEKEEKKIATVQEDPVDVENDRIIALLNLGILKQLSDSENDLDEAIEIFDTLFTQNKHPDAAYLLAQTYEKKGDEQKAKEFTEIACFYFSQNYALG